VNYFLKNVVQDKNRVYADLAVFQHEVIDVMNNIDRSQVERGAFEDERWEKNGKKTEKRTRNGPIFRYSWKSKGVVQRVNKFINLSCIHRSCPFQYWFKYEFDEAGQPCNISFYRHINRSHHLPHH
jgi:hypothetical protein